MSAGKTVKFAISVKELNVTFEGDIHSAERMHSEVAGALTTLASAQKMLTAPPKSAPPIEINPPGGRRRSGRRQRAPANVGTEAANNDVAGAGESDAGGDVPGSSGPRGGPGAQILITQLKDGGFFGEERTIAHVRGALAAKGHSFKVTELGTPLKRLTQKDVLHRRKDPIQNQWVYFAA